MIQQEIEQVLDSVITYSDISKVWVYYATESFEKNSLEINTEIQSFTSKWTSHGHEVQAQGFVILNQIILLIADTAIAEVSGCSTDSSVKFIQSIADKFQLDLFNRDSFYTIENNEIKRNQLSDISLQDKTTNVLNPFFKDLGEWRTSFIQPLLESKYRRMI
jgi:hypothetical protein